jgi:hypothetical protein
MKTIPDAAVFDFIHAYFQCALWSSTSTEYLNKYRHCGQEWEDRWSCACNDKCPVCDKEIEPYESEEMDCNLDDHYSMDDLDDEFRAEQEQECRAFLEDAGKMIAEEILLQWNSGKEIIASESGPIPRELLRTHKRELTYASAGHDFWLTRVGHGAGFWDGDWPKNGDALTEICKKYKEIDLYVGDDGKIYGS